MIKLEIDISGITKTNSHWNNVNILRMVLQQIKKTMNDNKARLYTSDTSVVWYKLYTPRGTVIITNRKITSQISKQENNHPLARWTTFTISLPNLKKSQS